MAGSFSDGYVALPYDRPVRLPIGLSVGLELVRIVILMRRIWIWSVG
jgi:hypothetical protein